MSHPRATTRDMDIYFETTDCAGTASLVTLQETKKSSAHSAGFFKGLFSFRTFHQYQSLFWIVNGVITAKSFNALLFDGCYLSCPVQESISSGTLEYNAAFLCPLASVMST